MTEIYVDAPQREELAVLDQEFCLCPECGHGQLRRTIPATLLYGSNYKTRTQASSATKAIDDFLAFVLPRFPKGRVGRILEVGCNDLYTLTRLRDRADSLCGIDPIWLGREDENKDPKIRVIGGFFENISPEQWGTHADVFLCSHTLEHIDDPVSLLSTLLCSAHKDSLLFFQFPGFEPLLNEGRFDQVHQQHLNYFSLRSVLAALELAGGELIDFAFNTNHWGALMIAFRKARAGGAARHRRFRAQAQEISREQIQAGYRRYQAYMRAVDDQITALATHRPVIGFGAALMLPLLRYHLPSLDLLEAVVDDDPGKQGRTYINFPVRIVPPSAVEDWSRAAVVVTAINSKQNIRAITQRLIALGAHDIVLPSPLV